MKEQPMVSVILSSYNREKFVGRTLDSIIAQTFTDWEAVVVDDGSADNSREVILDYAKKDNRIKHFFLLKNQGVCSGYNLALDHAMGKYFAIIDDDDFWEPEKLAVQIEYMEHHPQCGVCFTWVSVVDEDENTVPSYLCEGRDKIYNSDNRSRAQWLRTFFFEGCRVCHPTALIRREAIEKVGNYNYTYSQIQDYDLWIRIAKFYDIYVIPQKLINYRWFLKKVSNSSASSPKTLTRGRMEIYLVFTKFNDNLSDDLFYEAFHEDFYQKDAKSHNQLSCERALLMFQKFYLENAGKAIGFKMLDKLINCPETRAILEQQYQFTPKTLNEWACNPVFSDSTQEAMKQKDEYIKALEDNKSWHEQNLKNMQDAMKQKDEYIKALEDNKNWHEQNLKNMQDAMGQKDAYIKTLENNKIWHEQNLKSIQDAMGQKDAYIKTLENRINQLQQKQIEMEKSVSWKIIRFLRKN
jgi:glycosyltransferase involved in cell wall biosynthesis